jgi:pyruvate,water dikinase
MDALWPVDREIARSIGGKTLGLVLLDRAGFRVPPTWVVPVGGQFTTGTRLPHAAMRWAVRSSATVEDDFDHSFAGMFHSELDVARDDIAAAVSRVASSADSARVRGYAARCGIATDAIGVAVLLHPYVQPRAAGVWIGRGRSAGRLEWVAGAGDTLVSGVATPSWEEWTDDAVDSDTAPLRCDARRVGVACLAVQRVLGTEADLEFAVLDSGLVWLQCRPVTGRLVAGRVPPPTAGGHILRGTAAAPGIVTGKAVVMDDPDETRWTPGAILVTVHTDPGWVPLMADAAALVTTTGGALCHTAIIARELGIPCVTGVEAATRMFRDGMLLHVDGTAGTVHQVDGQDGRTVP